MQGPSGTGKAASVLCMARRLLGDAYRYDDAVLEIHMSDDRTVDTVHNRITLFAQCRVTLPPGRHKIIILDEADSGIIRSTARTVEVCSYECTAGTAPHARDVRRRHPLRPGVQPVVQDHRDDPVAGSVVHLPASRSQCAISSP
jgi:hypothetical protein